MIPNILHFVFGMKPDFGGKPFSLVHYLAIRSALELNKPDHILFHYQYEPEGSWWDRIKPYLTLRKIEAPQEIFGNPLMHVAHQADVVRLQALKEFGGIYLDLDTISKKSLQDFLHNDFVIGEQFQPKYVFYGNTLLRLATGLRRMNSQALFGPKVEGLCNAVMMSVPSGTFVTEWLNTYRSFRSKGKDEFWGEHSVFLPLKLSKEMPDEITIADPRLFHYPVYNNLGLKNLFEKNRDFKPAYIHHLWESQSWDKYLCHLTPELIKRKDTTYNVIARKFLP